MDRYRGGDRYNNPNDSQPYRHPHGPPASRSSNDSPINRHRGSFSSNRRPFDNSPPRYALNSDGGGPRFRLVDGDGGFRPVGVQNARSYHNNNNPSSEFEVPLSGPRFSSDYKVPLSGQKRPFDFPGKGGSPIERFSGGGFEKRSFNGDGYDKRHGDGGNFIRKQSDCGNVAKLFVGSGPKTATEDDVR